MFGGGEEVKTNKIKQIMTRKKNHLELQKRILRSSGKNWFFSLENAIEKS